MILLGDCLQLMPALKENSVDSIVTDPPYGWAFMGKDWDYGVPGVHFWKEALRVAKPGAHLLAFGGSRTYHRLTCAIEDAGWEIRDCIMWVYGSGFPKSHDVSKAIDREAGMQRDIICKRKHPTLTDTDKIEEQANAAHGGNAWKREWNITAPATEAAKQWEGWGTALKPSYEPIIVARKPMSGTVAENVQQHGTGAMNIDGCRIEINSEIDDSRLGGNGTWSSDKMANNVYEGGYAGKRVSSSPDGRWPANLIHDGSKEVLELFPDSDGCQPNVVKSKVDKYEGWGSITKRKGEMVGYEGVGSAARFFYCAKANQTDRDAGCEKLEIKPLAQGNQAQAEVKRGNMEHSGNSGMNTVKMRTNFHPTVKPTDLMKYLCRLVTRPNGIILDPFCGSGSTGKAAILENFRFVGIEKEKDYVEISVARITRAEQKVITEKIGDTSLFDILEY
jgi:DNA modification methylase